MSDDFDLDTKGLDAFLAALAKPPRVRIGILGDATPRTAGEGHAPSNATVGAIHEYGSSTSPQRSFLRMPLTNYLGAACDKAGLFDEQAIKEMIQTKSPLAILKKIAVLAETVVLTAFDTGGYGTWIPSNFRRKKNHQTLVETQQLRNAITSEVSEG